MGCAMRVGWCLSLVWCLMGCRAVAGPEYSARITVFANRETGVMQRTLFGTNITPGDRERMRDPQVIHRVREMGIGSCRFPNGCLADLYNWKAPKPDEASVDDWLTFCDAVDAEPYYTLNMQGGTEGLDGSPPDGASVAERIRYKHHAPNPCGYTNYHYGTLEEALELVQRYTIDRVLAGLRPILHYELGNENWGQAFTDFPPGIYGQTARAYAAAMRRLWDDAQRRHPELTSHRLHITAVGFPVMGNNMKDPNTPDRQTNILWTAELNRLHVDGLIDAVQEHYYPYGNADGGTLAWVTHNLRNIWLVRRGVPNPALKGYQDPALAYAMPLECTEWNVKCWGPAYRPVAVTNPDFEAGTEGWTRDGDARADPMARRRGLAGLLMTATHRHPVEIRQRIQLPTGTRIVLFSAWVSTSKRQAVTLEILSADGSAPGNRLGAWSSQTPGRWERLMIAGRPGPDVTQIDLVVRTAPGRRAYMDAVSVHVTDAERGHASLSAQTYEQVLFCVDALREMVTQGCMRSHLHHLAGDYACGQMTSAGLVKPLGLAYQLFTGRTGDRVVQMRVSTPVYAHRTAGAPWATDFNGLAPDRSDVPALTALATRDARCLYILLVNRSSDRTASVRIGIEGARVKSGMDIRMLSGADLDTECGVLSDTAGLFAPHVPVKVAPLSVQMLQLTVEN